jgi:hypothetical protein
MQPEKRSGLQEFAVVRLAFKIDAGTDQRRLTEESDQAHRTSEPNDLT